MGKIVVMGDSITYGKWDSEGGWVARLRNHIDTNHNIGKGNNVQVYNLGIPGEVAPRLAERFEGELNCRIETNENNLVIIAVGVNDSCPNNWMTKEKTPVDVFKKSFVRMIDTASAYQCKVICLGLTPVNPTKSKGLLFTDESVAEYDNYISEVCVAKKVGKIDLFGELTTLNFSGLLVDSVHPDREGHQILYQKILHYLETMDLLKYVIHEKNL